MALRLYNTLSGKIEEFQPLRISGNADRLKQLLLNLVSNAIKFTPDGGKITFGLSERDDSAILRVSDTGTGIPPNEVERIFDRFYQVDTSRSNQGGAGLGLSIAKWIVEAHGGTIEVKSTPNVQTVFTVRLPMEPDTFPLVSEDGQSYSAMALQKLGLSRRKTNSEPAPID